MSEKQRNLPDTAILAAFESTAFGRMGMAGEYPRAAETLDTIAGKVHEAMYTHIGLVDEARTTVWEKGDRTIRAVMAVGSIATRAWSFPYKRRSRVLLYPNSVQLADLVVLTDDKPLALSAFKAACDEFTLHRDGVPSGVINSAAELSRISDEYEHLTIFSSMPRIFFSDNHTDSSESGDTHMVDRYLYDEGLSETFRRFLMKRALQDARKTSYKPHVWQAQLDVTFRGLADSLDNPLRFEARRELDIPTSDEEYLIWRGQKEQQKAQTKAQESAQIQQIAAKGALLKAMISETLGV